MLILPSLYLPPIQYFAHLYADPVALEDRGEHFVKQTYRNRCYISTPNGPLPLTIPVVREGNGAHTPMRDVRISSHGNWRHLHWNALVSAYENSPYFEYYADDFHPFYERSYEFLVDFNAELQILVLDLLQLTPQISTSPDYIRVLDLPEATDLRTLISPKRQLNDDTSFHAQTYYQVFQQRTGFLPNLSIVDLLFNLGPESRLILKQSLYD